MSKVWLGKFASIAANSTQMVSNNETAVWKLKLTQKWQPRSWQLPDLPGPQLLQLHRNEQQQPCTRHWRRTRPGATKNKGKSLNHLQGERRLLKTYWQLESFSARSRGRRSSSISQERILIDSSGGNQTVARR